jgi:hypothetical protein
MTLPPSNRSMLEGGWGVTRSLFPLLTAIMVLALGCAPLPNGSTDASLSGVRPGLLCTLIDDGVGGVVHILVLQPAGSGIGSNGGVFELGLMSVTERMIWTQGGKEHDLAFTYRGFRRTLEVNGTSWSLGDANTFVIRLDEQWQATVEAVPLKTLEVNSEQVLEQIQRALPDDSEIRSLQTMRTR